MSVSLQLEIVDGDHRAKRESADSRVIGERARSRPERGVPLALHRLFDVLGACLGAEDARALQADRRARYAFVRHETIGPQAPVQRAVDRKSTRRTPVTNSQISCSLALIT